MIKQPKPIILCFLLMALTVTGSRAQVVMTTQLPPIGVTQKAQLWNLLLSNSSTGPVDVHIELSLLNLFTNQTVLTGTGRRFTLAKGAKVIQWGDVQPVVYNAAGGSGIDANPNGFLPAGNYKACYNLIRYTSDMKEVIAEECTDIEIAPLNPPQLTLPADGDTLETTYPQFSWLPPAPANLFQKLIYEIKVVELLPGQSHGEAIQNNLPVAGIGQLSQPLYSYPASSKAFEKEKDYVWQVTAKDINNYSVKTEVWFFTTRRKKTNRVQTLSYARLQQGISPAQFMSNGILKFVYVNDIGDKKVFYKIYNRNDDEKATKANELELRPGENFVDLPLDDVRSIREGESYVFELLNSAGEKWKMQFIYYEKVIKNKTN